MATTETTEAAADENQRVQRRRRTLLGAQIQFNDGMSVLDCAVRNIAEHGAQIDLPDTVHLPPAFDLHIPHDRVRRHAEVIWRSKDRVGIRFVEAPDGEAEDAS